MIMINSKKRLTIIIYAKPAKIVKQSANIVIRQEYIFQNKVQKRRRNKIHKKIYLMIHLLFLTKES